MINNSISKLIKRGFGFAGPYNPYRYKDHLVPREYPTDLEIDKYLTHLHQVPQVPMRNMRHVNPVRESGPLPPHDGPHTMEDIKKIFLNSSVPRDFHPCSTHPEEIMRRVPGITRKEAEFITKLGLNPDEEVDYAYIAHNIGLDVFYLGNQIYTARQVITNSKGEKVEVYWNSQAFEDLSMLNVGMAPVLEHIDYHWEIFLWGEPAIHPLVEFDLSVPGTWFEYEEETWQYLNIQEDQCTIPEEQRVYPSPKHPNCSRTLWKSQDDLQEIENMKNPNWYPKGTKYNVYNQNDFVRERIEKNETASLN